MTPPRIIPGRFLQTGKDRRLTPKAKAAVASLRRLHPDWEYQYFDDAAVRSFVASVSSQYLRVFEAFPHPIQRVDFFRYLAVFRLGGFYFDLDIFLAEPLTGLLDRGCVFPFEELTLSRHLREEFGIDWEIGNYGFGAAPGHPFLAAIIENCVKAQVDRVWSEPMMRGIPRLFRREFQVLNTTGPGLVTRTLAENPPLARDVTVLFPDDVCNTANWHLFGPFGVHLMDGSWRTRGSYVWRRLAARWEVRRRRQGLAASRELGPTRVWPVGGAA